MPRAMPERFDPEARLGTGGIAARAAAEYLRRNTAPYSNLDWEDAYYILAGAAQEGIDGDSEFTPTYFHAKLYAKDQMYIAKGEQIIVSRLDQDADYIPDSWLAGSWPLILATAAWVGIVLFFWVMAVVLSSSAMTY
jgi:hypothetical protein